MKNDKVLNLKGMASHEERTARVIDSLKSLSAHQKLHIVQDQEPGALCESLSAQYGEQLECSAREDSDGWQVRIERTESCCGFC